MVIWYPVSSLNTDCPCNLGNSILFRGLMRFFDKWPDLSRSCWSILWSFSWEWSINWWFKASSCRVLWKTHLIFSFFLWMFLILWKYEQWIEEHTEIIKDEETTEKKFLKEKAPPEKSKGCSLMLLEISWNKSLWNLFQVNFSHIGSVSADKEAAKHCFGGIASE
jgi:hypothetical protein